MHTDFRPMTPVERAFDGLRIVFTTLGRDATGRSDLIDSKRVLKGIADARKALDTLEAATLAFRTEKTAIDRRAASGQRQQIRKMADHLVRNPHQIGRARALGLTEAVDMALERLPAEAAPAPVLPVQEPIIQKQRTGLLRLVRKAA